MHIYGEKAAVYDWSQRRSFQDEQFNQLTNYVFGHCDALILRESVSLDLMKRSNITTAKVEHGVDTAWLVDHHTEDFTASYAVQHWLDVAAQQKTVAITLRELAPFDKRLGTTQQAYEKPLPGWSIAFSTKAIR